MRVTLRLGIAVLVGVIAAWFTFQHIPPELSRAQFMAEVRAGHVHKVIIKDEEVITGESSTHGRFRTAFKKAEDAKLVTELRALGVEVVFEKSPEGLI
jgi:ATP-dependent Zn protease